MKYKAIYLSVFFCRSVHEGSWSTGSSTGVFNNNSIITAHSCTTDERTLTILCIVYIVAHIVHPQTSNCQIDL